LWGGDSTQRKRVPRHDGAIATKVYQAQKAKETTSLRGKSKRRENPKHSLKQGKLYAPQTSGEEKSGRNGESPDQRGSKKGQKNYDRSLKCLGFPVGTRVSSPRPGRESR